HLFGHFMGNMMVEPNDFTRRCPTRHIRRMCFFPAMEGVCDTPLHLFDHFMGNMMSEPNDFTRRCPT
ncbi:MAG: hypothetical protein SPK32_11605, partial [Bacteroidaceae bacterium]|nr:hypothetical protein [Bacteroidaceae bacterium]